jgi:L-threonylcarbamoyladenylate synthase
MPKETIILKIVPDRAEPDRLKLISDILKADGVMAYPTETFYGLGAIAFSKKAVRKIYQLKRREQAKPLSVVVSDIEMAENIAAALPPLFRTLAREFWPGPLTLVVEAKPVFPKQMMGPGQSLAMRVPGAHWLRDLVRYVGVPITATSANISGEREIATAEEIIKLFNRKLDLIVDGGPTAGGLPSTIVDLVSREPRILRVGAVPLSLLQKFLS